jgi:hypothetical protein
VHRGAAVSKHGAATGATHHAVACRHGRCRHCAHGTPPTNTACWAAEQRLQRPLTAGDQPQLQALLADALTAAPVAHAEAAQQLLAWLPQGEVAPVCAVLGGVIANNVVAAVSGASAPLHNLLCYSLADSRAVVERPPPAAGAVLAHAAGAAAAQQQHKQPPAAPSEVVAIDSD